LSSTFKGVFKQNLMLKTPISSSKPRKAPPNYKSYLDAINPKKKKKKKKSIVKTTMKQHNLPHQTPVKNTNKPTT
jgi:hypothetical protein